VVGTAFKHERLQEMEHEHDQTTLQNELSFEGYPSMKDESPSISANDANDSQPVSNGSDGRSASHPMLVIVMGVSGCGKSTLAQALADALHLPFVDGDSLHPPSSIAKMSAGTPLTDDDRKPWLELIRTRAEHVAVEQQHAQAPTSVANDATQEPKKTPHGLVVACSSLKLRYRTILRGHEEPSASALPEGVEPPHPDVLSTFFVYIKGDRETLLSRMSSRKGHFMKAEMLDSQLATLESPEGEEGVVTVTLEDETEEQVANAVKGLKGFVGAELDVSS